MKMKRIPVRVIHTPKEGYTVELYVAPKDLVNPVTGMKPLQGTWRKIKSFGRDFVKAWACRNAELNGLDWYETRKSPARS